jgi:hypothetical protein
LDRSVTPPAVVLGAVVSGVVVSGVVVSGVVATGGGGVLPKPKKGEVRPGVCGTAMMRPPS